MIIGMPTRGTTGENTTTIFIGFYTTNITEDELLFMFHSFGDIIGVRKPNDKPFAYIKFRHRDDAERAVAEMNRFVVRGCSLLVDFAATNYAGGVGNSSANEMPHDHKLQDSEDQLLGEQSVPGALRKWRSELLAEEEDDEIIDAQQPKSSEEESEQISNRLWRDFEESVDSNTVDPSEVDGDVVVSSPIDSNAQVASTDLQMDLKRVKVYERVQNLWLNRGLGFCVLFRTRVRTLSQLPVNGLICDVCPL